MIFNGKGTVYMIRTIQWRFPRSKRKRIQNKWKNNKDNYTTVSYNLGNCVINTGTIPSVTE